MVEADHLVGAAAGHLVEMGSAIEGMRQPAIAAMTAQLSHAEFSPRHVATAAVNQCLKSCIILSLNVHNLSAQATCATDQKM